MAEFGGKDIFIMAIVCSRRSGDGESINIRLEMTMRRPREGRAVLKMLTFIMILRIVSYVEGMGDDYTHWSQILLLDIVPWKISTMQREKNVSRGTYRSCRHLACTRRRHQIAGWQLRRWHCVVSVLSII